MKDQNALLRKCIMNDIPAIVFQGTDLCAPEILDFAYETYKKNGATEEFLADFDLLRRDFNDFASQQACDVRLPSLSQSEAETVRDTCCEIEGRALRSMSPEQQSTVKFVENYGFSFMSADRRILFDTKGGTETLVLYDRDRSTYSVRTENGKNPVYCIVCADGISYPSGLNDFLQEISRDQQLGNSKTGILEERGISCRFHRDNGISLSLRRFRLCSAGCKTMYCTVNLQDGRLSLSDCLIADSSVHSVTPLAANDILISMSSSDLVSLLRGSAVEMAGKSYTLKRSVSEYSLAEEIINRKSSSHEDLQQHL